MTKCRSLLIHLHMIKPLGKLYRISNEHTLHTEPKRSIFNSFN